MFAVELHGEGEGHEALSALMLRAHAAIGRREAPIYRPHVSLGVFNADADATAENAFAVLAKRLTPVTVAIESLAAFPVPPGVVFAAPVVTNALLEMHRVFLDAFAALRPKLWPYYETGAWVPHVTLAMPARVDEQATIVSALAADWQPLSFALTEIGMVSVPDARVLAVSPLRP